MVIQLAVIEKMELNVAYFSNFVEFFELDSQIWRPSVVNLVELPAVRFVSYYAPSL